MTQGNHQSVLLSRWAPRQAVAELSQRLSRFDAVLGVGFGCLEDEQEIWNGESGLIVFVDLDLEKEVERLKRFISTKRFGGYRVVTRPPRTTFAAYWEFLKKNGVEQPERFDCLPDPFWLDSSKIHRMVQRQTRRSPQAEPSDPATAVYGEIFVIEDDGTLVANPGSTKGKDGVDEVVDYQAIFVKFRQQFGDHYDFVYIHHDVASGLNGGGGVSPTLFNNITGINHYKGDSYNGRAGWNTTKLQSYQAVRSFQMRRMLHETAHRWLAYVNHREGGSTSTNLHQDLLATNPDQGLYHWGNWCDDENSCMDYDYFDWVDAPDGYQQDMLTAGEASVDEFRYFGLDLYLMGLMTPAEVAGFRYLENPQDPDANGIYSATLHPTVVNDVIAEHGARNPDAASSQRVFHQAYILLTRNLAEVGDLTTGLVQTFDRWRRDFEQRFREATLNRAFIDTRLLHGNFSSLYIRDNASDNGTSTTLGVTWDSPDIWVRQADDNSTEHQDTDRSHDNYLRARVWNSSAQPYEDVTVRFYIGNHAENLPGTDFEYPEDWRLDRFLGEDEITVPAGGSAIAKVTWRKEDIPPAIGWHPCLLVEVLPMEVTPEGLHRRTQNKKLAQKNITLVGSPGDPEDGQEFRFTIGRPRAKRRFHILVVERVIDVQGLEIALAPAAEGIELLPNISTVIRPKNGTIEPPNKLKVDPGKTPLQICKGNQLYIPKGCWFGYGSGQGECWTTIRFATDTIFEIGGSLREIQSELTRRWVDSTKYHVLPAWYRTAVRIPALTDQTFQVVRANLRLVSTTPVGIEAARLRFMEYDPDGLLIGGVDYEMKL
jgi:hypothetical protein